MCRAIEIERGASSSEMDDSEGPSHWRERTRMLLRHSLRAGHTAIIHRKCGDSNAEVAVLRRTAVRGGCNAA